MTKVNEFDFFTLSFAGMALGRRFQTPPLAPFNRNRETASLRIKPTARR
jgi:hypothetical protein